MPRTPQTRLPYAARSIWILSQVSTDPRSLLAELLKGAPGVEPLGIESTSLPGLTYLTAGVRRTPPPSEFSLVYQLNTPDPAVLDDPRGPPMLDLLLQSAHGVLVVGEAPRTTHHLGAVKGLRCPKAAGALTQLREGLATFLDSCNP